MTTCKRGHERSEKNTYKLVKKNGNIVLNCRVCARLIRKKPSTKMSPYMEKDEIKEDLTEQVEQIKQPLRKCTSCGKPNEPHRYYKCTKCLETLGEDNILNYY